MKRFEVWQANLPCRDNSSIQQGCRPIIIVSNDHANQHSPVVTVVPLTSKAKKLNPLSWLLLRSCLSSQHLSGSSV